MPHSSLRAGGQASVETTRPGGEHGAVVGGLIAMGRAIANVVFKSDLACLQVNHLRFLALNSFPFW
jgi:hypothetical protein